LAILENRQQSMTRGHRRAPIWLQFFIGLFLVVFVIGGFYSSYLFYATLREIVARTDLPALPVVQLPSLRLPEAQADAEVTQPLPAMGILTPEIGPAQVPAEVPSAPVLANDQGINVLLLGIDRRGGTGWGHLTDTIIIARVDPINKTAAMLSIPRDLQLPIPGNGEDRINTANVYGYKYNYPGGGPALLKRTIEANFGIPIDYYVMIDFEGFIKIIDTLGGIDVNVPKTLHDTKFPDPRPGDPYAYKTVHFDPGWQHMAGKRALTYARSRMSTTDFDRASRQQQILLAIREKALSLGVLNLAAKLPSLLATTGNMAKTDMSVEEMIQLAQLAPDVDLGSIKMTVIQKPMVYGYRRADGAAIQLPKWDLIKPVVDEMFSAPVVLLPTPTPTPPAPPTPTPTLEPVQVEGLQQLAEEGARIAIQNGTLEPNYAARVAAMLMEQGFQVVEFGDADRLDYPGTVIVDYTGKALTLERLIDLFKVTPENVRHSPNLRSQIDIRIIVGQDFSLPNP
jgi:polyisoprenyl-teichoic acid--peptidoglycan teichoic acid transferase